MKQGGGQPVGRARRRDRGDYGGLDKLKEEFNAKGAGQFGSGWAWLIADADGKLKVTSHAQPGQSADGRRQGARARRCSATTCGSTPIT